jgi:hypothetical protein
VTSAQGDRTLVPYSEDHIADITDIAVIGVKPDISSD